MLIDLNVFSGRNFKNMFLFYLSPSLHLAMAQESFKCPDDFGFYPHDLSCDKYWKCDNNVAELKTCGNGLAFDASDSKFLTENCDYLHNVDCGDRSKLGKNFINYLHCEHFEFDGYCLTWPIYFDDSTFAS